jgi:hypothetical protein
LNDAQEDAGTGTAMPTRWVELGVGAFLLALALLVIADSLRVGAGWADDGPRAGYFPFYIGSALLGASLWIIVQQLRHWSRLEAFAERAQLKDVVSVLVPMIVHVALVKFIGIYVASALLIAYFMVRHGSHRRWVTALVSIGVPIVSFLVFERWFVVPLPKGPLEALLGF